MSRVFASEITSVLQREVFPCLLRDWAGLVARPGAGTYLQFLEQAGLVRPWRIPRPGTPAWTAFTAECNRVARWIVNRLEASSAVELDPGTGLAVRILDRCTLYRATDRSASRRSIYGEWWFRKEILDKASAAARTRNGQVMQPPLFRMQLRDELRRWLAIRVDWNAIETLHAMTVFGRFPAVVATGKEHPLRTSPGGDGPSPVLRGGAEQVWLPWTPLVPVQVIDLVAG